MKKNKIHYDHTSYKLHREWKEAARKLKEKDNSDSWKDNKTMAIHSDLEGGLRTSKRVSGKFCMSKIWHYTTLQFKV